MKFRKFFVLFLLFIFCTAGVMANAECQPNYRNVRKMSKSKKIQSKRSKTYKKKTQAHRRGQRTINSAYVLKSKRRTSYHY